MDRKRGHLLKIVHRGLRWGLLTGAAVIASIGMEALPVAAAELANWDYDSQSRSLTVTIPSNVSPSVSVIATDQLLLALPDTQMGEVTGLNVDDGIVDNITLEQSTPDTLWIVMEFAEGTVLANEQRVVPTENTAETVGQQWEIRPALVASSRTAPVPVAAEATSAEIGTDAADLQAPEVSIAQADFPDLPILEPGISLTEPVSVPPINATEPAPATNVAPPPPPPPPPPPAPPTVEASRSEVSAPELEEPALEEAVAASDIPEEPPFLGEFEVPVVNEPGIEPALPTAVSVPDEPIPTLEADERIDDSIAEELPAEDLPAEDLPAEDLAEAEQIPIESVAAAPDFDPGPNADFLVEPAPATSEFEPAELDLSDQEVTPQNSERWPEPIPFGTPLPQ